MRLRAVFILTILILMLASAKGQDAPQWDPFATNKSISQLGCTLVKSRQALESTLRSDGYAGALPAINFDNHEVVILTSPRGNVMPTAYSVPDSTVHVLFENAPAFAANRLLVMQIGNDAASAIDCLLQINHPSAQPAFQPVLPVPNTVPVQYGGPGIKSTGGGSDTTTDIKPNTQNANSQKIQLTPEQMNQARETFTGGASIAAP